MRIRSIELLKDEEWLAARIGLEPAGHLTLWVKRNSGAIWRLRKDRGDATLAFLVQPENRRYYQDELHDLVTELSRHDFLGVGTTSELLFADGLRAQPEANFDPRDLLDNASDCIFYTSDAAIPGVARSDSELPHPGDRE